MDNDKVDEPANSNSNEEKVTEQCSSKVEEEDERIKIKVIPEITASDNEVKKYYDINQNEVENNIERDINDLVLYEEKKDSYKIVKLDSKILEQESSSIENISEVPTEILEGSFITNKSSKLSTESNTLLLRKESQQFCRICHEIGTDNVFISPCYCKGSLSLVHKWCLERWLAESDTNHCELCGYVFNVHRKPKYNIIWSIFMWLWNAAPKRERRLLLCDTLLFVLICPIIMFVTIFSFQIAETTLVPQINEKIAHFQNRLELNWRREEMQLFASFLARIVQMTIVSLIITFDVGFASWSVLRIQHHTMRWYRWYRRNSNVILSGYPEIITSNLNASESSSNIRAVTF